MNYLLLLFVLFVQWCVLTTDANCETKTAREQLYEPLCQLCIRVVVGAIECTWCYK